MLCQQTPDYQQLHQDGNFYIWRFCEVAVPMNHLHAYSHVWNTVFPLISVLKRSKLCIQNRGRF